MTYLMNHSLLRPAFHLIGLCAIALVSFASHAMADDAEKAAKRIEKSTVRIVLLAGGELQGHGTGFILNKQGHVATNRHVIEDAEHAVIVFASGDRLFRRSAELVAVSSTADLAILKIDPIPAASSAKLATSELAPGQVIMTVGFPGALDSGTWATLDGVEETGTEGEERITSEASKGDFVPAVFSGAVAKNIKDAETCMVLHSAKISGGNSGGPLIDAEGRVCGINTALYPASLVGVDYPISIHVSELVALAKAHSIPIDVTSFRAKSSSGFSGLQTMLLITLSLFAVVLFLMLLRKPRMVMVDALSRVVHSKRHGHPQPSPRQAHSPAPPAPAPPGRTVAQSGSMRLRGRDLHGQSYDLSFSEPDFHRHGGRLVIGRNNDLSQLVVAHDSVSRQHATLLINGNSVRVEDRNSGNGTRINGRELSVGDPPETLAPGDKITLGEVDLIFEILS